MILAPRQPHTSKTRRFIVQLLLLTPNLSYRLLHPSFQSDCINHSLRNIISVLPNLLLSGLQETEALRRYLIIPVMRNSNTDQISYSCCTLVNISVSIYVFRHEYLSIRNFVNSDPVHEESFSIRSAVTRVNQLFDLIQIKCFS